MQGCYAYKQDWKMEVNEVEHEASSFWSQSGNFKFSQCCFLMLFLHWNQDFFILLHRYFYAASALASRKLNFVQGDFWAVKNVNFNQVGLFLMCFFQATLILDFSGFRLDVEVFWFVY